MKIEIKVEVLTIQKLEKKSFQQLINQFLNNMKFLHKNLAKGRWFELQFIQQMANIGSEVERAILHKNKGNKENMFKAIERALELFVFNYRR